MMRQLRSIRDWLESRLWDVPPENAFAVFLLTQPLPTGTSHPVCTWWLLQAVDFLLINVCPVRVTKIRWRVWFYNCIYLAGYFALCQMSRLWKHPHLKQLVSRSRTAIDKSPLACRVAGKVLNVQKKNLQKHKESGGNVAEFYRNFNYIIILFNYIISQKVI